MSHVSREVVASAARTATGQSSAIGTTGHGDNVGLLVAVTAVSGATPTMTLSVEWSHDGTTWAQADAPDTFSQITAASQKVKMFDRKAPYYRVVWTIAGTVPSFTFSIKEW